MEKPAKETPASTSDLRLGLGTSNTVPRSLTGSEATATMCGSKEHEGHDDASGQDQIEHAIHELARTMTSRTENDNDGKLLPLEAGGPLDPNSPLFDGKKWSKAFFKARTAAADGNAPRTTGVAFKNLDVFGFGTTTDFQKTVFNVVLEAINTVRNLFGGQKQRIDILRNCEGLVKKGEMLCVLGPPGSGCSTLLRTIAGDTQGFYIDKGAVLNYQGIRSDQMKTVYRGECIYTAEVDHHFPHLTVGETLFFAARCRCPETVPTATGLSKTKYAEHLCDVIMALFGISHTKNTRVGDDFIRGVSGGERKRVTIAEAALSYSPMQCWDNSTRGLDSANAIEFCRTLRMQADILGCTSCVAIYQAPQAAYDIFDKVIVLYQGRQIFFGRADEAKGYFESLGFICPEQQTTADFLTSMTSQAERLVRPGWEDRVPRSPDDFASIWKANKQRARLIEEIDQYIDEHPFDGEHHQQFFETRRIEQSNMQRPRSPFNLSYWQQMSITLWRSWTLLKGDPSVSLTMLIANLFQALIISSIFYNLPEDTSSFFRRTILLFFIVLINAFGSILEILTLYAKRRIVEKHVRYAFYHPSAEALSAIFVDLPYKIINSVLLNATIYFMCNLRREPGPFFFFLLFSFALTMCMSMLFRFIGSVTKSIAQAMAPSSIILLAVVLYTGFTIPPAYTQDWLGWMRWINPTFYGLESLFLNEFLGRQFECSAYIPSGPGYESVPIDSRVCSTVGAVEGQPFVDGGLYLELSYGFVNSHRWRNLAVIIAFTILFASLHLLACEYIASERSKGEVLIFTREAMQKRRESGPSDVETGSESYNSARQSGDGSDTVDLAQVERQTATFHWSNVCYDIKIKGEPRRILDHVDGWVKPGTLTALMGVSGAGKTTLLDVLASRVTMGVVTGEMLVDGHHRDSSFQRKTGYVQQQDLHLATSTVREALSFSALLRQPARYTRQQKLDYVNHVITILGMEEYSDAVIGIPGEGLNVEQRKRLTIGVELAARPQLLLFLDEPTSGLDSQTSWSICDLMERLTQAGQAVLCTIHQPSAVLFQRFDRLLLLAKGGETVYFGEIGKNSSVLMDYFQANGGLPLPRGVNPAEHMLEIIGAVPGAHTDIDWPAVWRQSPEYRQVKQELQSLCSNQSTTASGTAGSKGADPSEYNTFAAPFHIQLPLVTARIFQQFWRSPMYILSKFVLSAGAALFIGLSILNSDNTMRGLQNQMFGVFLFLTIFAQMIEQITPAFCEQRTLYEARERPCKSYSWQAFLIGNIIVEIVWNSLMSVFCFICWYFPIGLYRNAEWTDQVHSRGITLFLLVWAFFIFTSSFAHMLIAGLPNPDVAGGIMNLLFIMMFSFCGVLAGPQQLPGFWIFMYRVNPFTYVIEGFLGTALANAPVECAANEIVSFAPTDGSTCDEYMADYISATGGYLVGASGRSTTECHFCSMDSTNTFLASINTNFSNRWRNFGLLWVYIAFNLAAAAFFYWLARVPKDRKVKKE